MKYLSIITVFCLAGCVSQEQERQMRLEVQKVESDRREREHQQRLKDIEDANTPKPLSKEEEALVKESAKAYYVGVARSIRALDDGISPADSIAKAAVSENINLLRVWKRRQMANISRMSKWAANEVDEGVNSLPSRAQIDDATAMVLRLRKRVEPPLPSSATEGH